MHEQFLVSILSAIIEEPESLKVIKTDDDRGTLLSVSVARGDMGRVIGKQGRLIEAIRSIVSAYGAKNKVKLSVKVNEP